MTQEKNHQIRSSAETQMNGKELTQRSFHQGKKVEFVNATGCFLWVKCFILPPSEKNRSLLLCARPGDFSHTGFYERDCSFRGEGSVKCILAGFAIFEPCLGDARFL